MVATLVVPSALPSCVLSCKEHNLGHDGLWLLLNKAVAWTHTQDLPSFAQALHSPRWAFAINTGYTDLFPILQWLPRPWKSGQVL